MLLQTFAACEKFVSSSTAAEVAHQLRQDQKLCRSGQLPSGLASYLAKHPLSIEYRDSVAYHLQPSTNTSGNDARIPKSISRLQYQSIVQGIQAHLSQLAPPADDAAAVKEAGVPSTKDFEAALRVLNYLSSASASLHVTEKTPLSDLRTIVASEIPLSIETWRSDHASISSLGLAQKEVEQHSRPTRKCYICHTLLSPSNLNTVYPCLCSPCLSFNAAGSSPSLPSSLDLDGRTALVTGGRVGLGFHTALRLLRCGARVIVSTRYPCDSISRYHAVADSSNWIARLKVVGADFRAARDVFRLVASVKEILQTNWQNSKLHILINNAAQTLTNSVEEESMAVTREKLLLEITKHSPALVEENGLSYLPRIRGGTSPLLLEPWDHGGDLPPSLTSGRIGGSGYDNLMDDQPSRVGAERVLDCLSVAPAPISPSSWTQTLQQIPYEDVITAHSVNTFVPLILTRELTPLMASGTAEASEASGYIVNVSSRESLWESNAASSAKNGHHVHTNMSKAALNMLTITEAGPSWQKWKVAINTVDPGFMSADPVYEQGLQRQRQLKRRPAELSSAEVSGEQRKCPITYDDGAARVLWPVALGWGKDPGGEGSGKVLHGKFLKHFGGVEVDAC